MHECFGSTTRTLMHVGRKDLLLLSTLFTFLASWKALFNFHVFASL